MKQNDFVRIMLEPQERFGDTLKKLLVNGLELELTKEQFEIVGEDRLNKILYHWGKKTNTVFLTRRNNDGTLSIFRRKKTQLVWRYR